MPTKAQLQEKIYVLEEKHRMLTSLITGYYDDGLPYYKKVCGDCGYYYLFTNFKKDKPGRCVKHPGFQEAECPKGQRACPCWMPQRG